MAAAPDRAEIERQGIAFESGSPEEILRWTTTSFAPDALLTMSFQHEGVVIAHMLRTIAPETPVLFIDTGYHFPETLAYRDRLQELFGLEVRNLTSVLPRQEFIAQHGDDLWDRDPDLCCQINKVEPMQLALRGVKAWINGRRRDQAGTRLGMPIVELLGSGLVKVNPLANWHAKTTWAYMEAHQIPPHPLFEQGYASIGCHPCTRPILAGEDDRAGRWAGRGKTECGLHTIGMAAAEPAPAAADPTAAPTPAPTAPPGRSDRSS